MRKDTNKKKPEQCPVRKTLEVIGGRWKPTILFNLLDGPKRFNELQRMVGGPSARILTVQLRELEAHRIVKRKVFEQIPPKVEYHLTEKGRELTPILDSMAKWGLANR